MTMLSGAHTVVFSEDPEAARAFFRDVLRLDAADAGGGWLIFALPPAELAFHPGEPHQELYLMCEDLEATMRELRGRGVEFAAGVSEQSWGRLVRFKIPGGGAMGLYEPRHPRSASG